MALFLRHCLTQLCSLVTSLMVLTCLQLLSFVLLTHSHSCVSFDVYESVLISVFVGVGQSLVVLRYVERIQLQFMRKRRIKSIPQGLVLFTFLTDQFSFLLISDNLCTLRDIISINVSFWFFSTNKRRQFPSSFRPAVQLKRLEYMTFNGSPIY